MATSDTDASARLDKDARHVENLVLNEATTKELNVIDKALSEHDVDTAYAVLDALHSRFDPTQNFPASNHYNTLLLIFLLHLVFFLQWRNRSTRKDVELSYSKVVTRRKYHYAFLALFSHAPADIATAQHGNRTVSQHLLPTNTTTSEHSSNFPRLNERIQVTLFRFRVILWSLFNSLSSGARFSGLPLLVYTTHLLWQIRALEEYFDEKGTRFGYKRTIFVLIVLCISIQLLLTRSGMLLTSTHMSSMSPTTRLLYNRGSSSFTPVTVALLVLYGTMLPYVPLQLLPFVPWFKSCASDLGFIIPTIILSLLARASDRIGALVGAFSGFLFVMFVHGFNDVLEGSSHIKQTTESFQSLSNVQLAWCAFMCILSLSARNRGGTQSTRNGNHRSSTVTHQSIIPCIDHVGWNENGLTREEKALEDLWLRGLQEDEEQNDIPNGNDDSIDVEDGNYGAFNNADDRVGAEDGDEGEEGTFLSWDSTSLPTGNFPRGSVNLSEDAANPSNAANIADRNNSCLSRTGDDMRSKKGAGKNSVIRRFK